MEWVRIDKQEFDELKKESKFSKYGAGSDAVFYWKETGWKETPKTLRELYDLAFLRYFPQSQEHFKKDGI